MNVIRCQNCDEVSVADVQVHDMAGVAAVTCPECGDTHEPVHADVDADVRRDVVDFVEATDHRRVGDMTVEVWPDDVGGGLWVSGRSRNDDGAEFAERIADALDGDFEVGHRSAFVEWSVVFGGDDA